MKASDARPPAANVAWREFASRQSLAGALAADVAAHLAQAIAERGRASIAVSGGTTPKLFFEALSNADIDWPAVTVTLVDERFVPPDSPRSNERLARENLLKGRAARARFVGLWHDAPDAGGAASAATAALDGVASPLDVAILGMGADGHTASFFPDATTLPALLDTQGERSVRSVDAPSAGEPRLSLPLSVLAGARFLALHIEGSEKRAVAERALSGERLPIGAAIAASAQPVQIFWAP